VQLIDEKTTFPSLSSTSLIDGFERLRTRRGISRRDHRAEVERDDALVLETFRNVAFDHRRAILQRSRLPDSGLADQDGLFLFLREST